ncbi:hypothetical protein ANCDUO_01971 [Ancylostoma duodenale]|uniref:Uncharacterized protein n=1 Tax=Ancylostoma duodenale TaxID=51022 RepID=A0A0C2DCV9_9BILA|nr:hypothetical protein ANCDUO_01971 [Ancylostoma duodenale]
MDCPKEFWSVYAVYAGIGISLILVLLIAASGMELEKKSQSHRSLQSGPSTLTSSSAFDGEDSIFKITGTFNAEKFKDYENHMLII